MVRIDEWRALFINAAQTKPFVNFSHKALPYT
jgi:hypothetical protein